MEPEPTNPRDPKLADALTANVAPHRHFACTATAGWEKVPKPTKKKQKNNNITSEATKLVVRNAKEIP